MRLMCLIQGGCKLETIREEWLKPKNSDDYPSLLRFSECIYCHDVIATITHPNDFNSRWSKAGRAYHRVSDQKVVNA
jgi:hypothetical protein